MEVFVDEGRRADYLLCAAVVASADVAAARRTMRALKPPNRRRLHMHSEGAVRRAALLARFMNDPPIQQAHVWRARMGGRPERVVRDECFRALVPGVLELGARRIVVESCSQDAQDERVIGGGLAREGAIGRVSYHVVPAASDELLWAADLVAWAYGAGGSARAAISELVTVDRLR